jgi:hypothetical protein
MCFDERRCKLYVDRCQLEVYSIHYSSIKLITKPEGANMDTTSLITGISLIIISVGLLLHTEQLYKVLGALFSLGVILILPLSLVAAVILGGVKIYKVANGGTI